MGTDQGKHGNRPGNIGNHGYRSDKAWVQIRQSKGTDQGKHGNRPGNIGNHGYSQTSMGTDQTKHGYRSDKAWVQIREHR